jgi:hypothetical protein
MSGTLAHTISQLERALEAQKIITEVYKERGNAMREALSKALAHIEMLEARLGTKAPLDLQPVQTKTAIKAALALAEGRETK